MKQSFIYTKILGIMYDKYFEESKLTINISTESAFAPCIKVLF